MSAKYAMPALALIAATLLVGVGYLIGTSRKVGDDRYQLATRQEIKQAKEEISNKYRNKDLYGQVDCQEMGLDEVRSDEEISNIFDQYLKVNKYGNRAVIRTCGNTDAFLIKDLAGKWQTTSVNVSLDTRANPYWRAACLADDILEADTVVRQENSSIDASNLYLCQFYNEQSYAKQALIAEGVKKPSEKRIYEYIDAYRVPLTDYAPADTQNY